MAVVSGGALAALWIALRLGAIQLTLVAFSVASLYTSLVHALACVMLLWRQPRAASILAAERSRRRWFARIAMPLLCLQVGVTLLNIVAPEHWELVHVLATFIAQHQQRSELTVSERQSKWVRELLKL